MRTLSATLLAAQQSASRVPCVRVEAKNLAAGVVRLDWERLYTGSEADCFHALTMPGDGSLVRARLTPVEDGRKLYRQRIANPGGAWDFSVWTYTSQNNCLVVAVALLGSEASIFWINDSREIRRIKSADNGASWSSSELLDYSPTANVNGMAAAYKPGGDLAVFFTDEANLYVKKFTGGSWGEKIAWDNPPEAGGELSGVAVVYDRDWDLIVSGQDSTGNYKLWSLIYGDGGDTAAGEWTALEEFAAAPSDGDFRYHGVFMDKPDVYRCFYVEAYSGNEPYSRPFSALTVPGSRFSDNLWREPSPFDLSSEYGLAIAHHGDYCWLTTPYGVWRASMLEAGLDLSADVVSLKQDTAPGRGSLTIELRNDEGNYASLPFPLDIGCRIDFSPGCVTAEGNEVSSGQTFMLEGYEYKSSGGKTSLMLHCLDGTARVNIWRARHQFRWNKDPDEMNVAQILEFVLARTGLKLDIISQSSLAANLYPDFAIHTADRGNNIIGKLLSYVPDLLFVEGDKSYLVNPLPSDASIYSYGLSHSIYEGRYGQNALKTNRVQVEGYDPSSGASVIADSFIWSDLDKGSDRLLHLLDRNIDTAVRAGQLGEAWLRRAEIESISGSIRVPVNCGQQLYDVIEITDPGAGLNAVKRRVMGLTLAYEPEQGIYEQRFLLGGV